MKEKKVGFEIFNKKGQPVDIDLENYPFCPECGSDDVRLVDTGCFCRIPGHSCWSAPSCNSCGYSGAGNSSGGLWYKPDGW